MYQRVGPGPPCRLSERDRDGGIFLSWLALQRLWAGIYHRTGPRKQTVKIHRSRARVIPLGRQEANLTLEPSTRQLRTPFLWLMVTDLHF